MCITRVGGIHRRTMTRHEYSYLVGYRGARGRKEKP